MIENILRGKLPLISAEETLADLGNRGDYVGASDISSCPRRVVISKLFKKEHDLEQLIVFQRGHLAENIIKKALLKWKEEMPERGVVTQYEVKALNGKVRAHLDFLIKDETRKLTVIEVKSANMVEQPYEAWLNQCNFQIGLLKQSPKTAGLPISGEVLAIDLKKGAVKEFPVEFSPEIFTAQMEKAEYLIKKIESAKSGIGIEDINTEPSALCGFCDHRHDCPSYNKSDKIPEDLKGLLKQYAQVNALSKDIENNLSLLKDEITCYGKPFKVSFDGIRASFTMSSFEALDIKRLKEELPEVAAEYSYPRQSSRLIVNY